MEITCNRNHSGIVRSKLEFRQIHIPSPLPAFFGQSIAQPAVGRDSSAHCHFLYSRLLRRLDQLVHKDFYKRPLESCTDILLVLLHEIRIFGYPVPDKIEQRCLDPAETVVQPRNMRLCKMETVRVALLREPVHHRTSRIAQPHHLGTFVERLSDCIIDGLAENFEFQRTVDPDNLGVAA